MDAREMIAVPAPNYTYNEMNHGRTEYEGFYGLADHIRFYGLHCHDFYEFYIHFQGAKYYGIDNEVFLLQPNQLLIIPPFHMHGMLCDEELRRYERAYLYLAPAFMAALGCGQIDLEGRVARLTDGDRFRFALPPDLARECGRLLHEVSKTGGSPTPWERFRDASRILPVLRIILEAAQQTAPDDMSPIPVNPMMHQVLIYINDHCTEPMTLKRLSERFGLSASTLSHEFRRYIHHSVYDYILYRRIMLAKRMLFGSAPIAEIAYRCGFGDYSNFLRAFRKMNGLSPNSYRQQMQKKRQVQDLNAVADFAPDRPAEN